MMMTSTGTLLSFHGDPAVKEKYLARVRAHQTADEIVQGYYWENGKGCAVGCTVHGPSHVAYENELGIPEWLAWLEDGLFEDMSAKDAKGWPLAFLEAIPVGSDLWKVPYLFFSWMMIDEKEGLVSILENGQVREAVYTIGNLLKSEADRTLTKDEIKTGDLAAAVLDRWDGTT